MLEVKSVNKIHQNKAESVHANQNISLKFANHSLVFICGESGSGKTTLLNLIGGLDEVTSGSILFNGEDICRYNEEKYTDYRNKNIGFISQTYDLIESFSVEDNVNIALALQGIEDKEKILNILDDVGLKSFAKRKAKNLSGGQKQRVAIARALVKNPNIILADEPTGNLDNNTSKDILSLLKKISETTLVIVISHNLELANMFADRIIMLSDGKVIDDKIINEITSTDSKKENTIKKSKLKINKLIYQHKAFILITLILLVIVTLLGVLITTTSYDLLRTNVLAMQENNNSYITINRKDPHYGYLTSLNDERQKYLSDYLNNIGAEYETNIGLYNDASINFQIGNYSKFYAYEDENCKWDVVSENKNGLKTYKHPYLCNVLSNASNESQVKMVNATFLQNKKYIGQFPTKPNEVIISDYLAHIILDYGTIDNDGNLYQPTTFEQIINDEVYIEFFGGLLLKISAIYYFEEVPYEEMLKMDHYFEEAKEEDWTYHVPKLYSWSEDMMNAINTIYIAENFFNVSELPKVTSLNAYNEDLLKYYYDGENYQIISNIKMDSEIGRHDIIIDRETLNKLTDNEFSKIINQEDYYYEVGEGMDATTILSDQYLEDTLIYMQDKGILNSKITIRLVDTGEYILDTYYEDYPLIITGFNVSGGNLMSDELIGKYFNRHYYVDSFIVKNVTTNQAYELLGNFNDTNKDGYTAYSKFSATIKNDSENIERISTIAKYSSIGISIFLTLVLSLFLILLIIVNKKHFILLMDLGMNKKSIKQSIRKTSLFLYFITLVPAIFLINIIVNIINNQVTAHYEYTTRLSWVGTYKIKYLFYDFNDVIFLIAIVTIIWFLATILSNLLINKIKIKRLPLKVRRVC